MRLRNIPRADGVIDAHRAVIKKPEEQRGQWAQVFGNEKPIYTYDLHHQEEMNKGNIMTEYEQKFSEKGNPINKLIAQRKEASHTI